MKLASLHTGLHLTLNKVPFMVHRILENGEYYLEKQSDLAIVVRTKEQLKQAFFDGEMVVHGKCSEKYNPERDNVDLTGLPQKDQKTILRKYQYIKEARSLLGDMPTKKNLEGVIDYVADILDDKAPPSVSSVFRWWKSWEDNNHDLYSLNNKKTGSNKARKIKGVVRSELDRTIDEIFLSKQKNTKQSVYEALVAKLNRLNSIRDYPLTIPSRSMVYRIIDDIDLYEVSASREGKRVADKKYRASGMGAQPQHILERVEVDHTPLDIMVVNPDTGLTDGRPYLTLLLDRYSRIPLGFEVGFECPSELSVMRALRNSILPKSDIKTTYPDIENEWPAYGTPTMLVCDNGLEFHSHQLRRMCWELGIDLQFCPKGKPEYKGAVERFLGTLNRDVCHRLPGTTFSNIIHRGDYNSDKEALLKLSDIKEMIHQWLIDIYCQKTHRITQRTPSSLWNEGTQIIDPILPESKDKLNLILTSQDSRQLSHKGIEFKGLYYNSSDITALRQLSSTPKQVTFRYDKENMGFIWVYDSINGDYIKVSCIDSDYAEGLTLRQHLAVRSTARAVGDSDQDIHSLLENKEKFREKINDKSHHRLMRERKKAARDQSSALRQHSKQKRLLSDIETFKQSIDDWDIDDIPDFSVVDREVNQ